ncbi:MAG: two-component system, OmpR family, phosphate regulon response regulator PhoB [Frankiales bacterium]|jgi:two-component system phosphate regulon response regulator PhoB|nr:two-component system, OmpR family, phosphate regulon response regulator PhoB [Frankiales bacterium]
MAYPAPAVAPSTLPRPTLSSTPMLRAVAGTGRDFAGRAADAGVSLTGPLQTGGLAVDLAGYVVTLDGEELDLSPRQVELLGLFLAAPRKVWSRDQLHWVCWGDTAPSRRVDVQLCRLRAKTGLDLFRNVRDRGWALRQL